MSRTLPDTQMLIDAIVGRCFTSYGEADHYVKVGLAKFTGNQHNEEWRWRRDALEKLGYDLLLRIYLNDTE